MRWSTLLPVMLIVGASVVASPAYAEAMPEYHLTLQDHKFQPATLKVPANTKFKVLVTNRNPTPSEFESSDFNREKIVLPNSTITVFIGPLDKGTYKFFDDFDHATTGVLVVE
ncbi:MAG TPA: cupredoxin domain-containing protein [Rhodanobacteraceae bacterium]